ncbi:hypothetical protein [Flavobacterium enshiense]|nr:hypothetical protein [Flavobacterium enshiense]
MLLTCVLLSCSSDDTVSAPEEQLTTNGTKLRKYVEKGSNGDIILGTEYEYEGDKLNRMIYSNGQIRKFFYIDDLITKIEDYGGNVIGATTYFSYDPNGKVLGIVSHRNDGHSGRAEFLYNADNTVTVNNYGGDAESQDLFGGSSKFFLEDGVIVKNESSQVGVTGTRTWTEDFTYDDKENPLNVILGFEKLRFYFYEEIFIHQGDLHNVVKEVHVSSEFTGIHTKLKTFTYNDYGFPIKAAITSDGNFDGTTEYYYEVQ